MDINDVLAISPDKISEIVDNLEERIIGWRRAIHKHPEAAWTEYRTTWLVYCILNELGWKVTWGRDVISMESRYGLPTEEELEKAEWEALGSGMDAYFLSNMRGGATGLVGELDTGRPGPVLAIRVDMDALNIEESYWDSHFPKMEGFISENHGIMHACGHDGHTAIGLGLACSLDSMRHVLCGKIILVFQPAEEGCRGAKSMIDAGVLKGVDDIIGIHLGLNAQNTGEIYPGVKGILATRKFDVKFIGKAAHAGFDPDSGRNALLSAADAVKGIHSILPHDEGISRVNVGKLSAGTARNIVPDSAYMQVETRGDTEEIEEYVYKHALKSIKEAADRYGVEYEIKDMGYSSHGESDGELVDIVKRAAMDMDEFTSIHEKLGEFGGSEDFALMMRAVQRQGGKACLVNIGSDLASGHHQKDFDFDEKSLCLAVKLLANIVLMNQNICDRGGK
jgi:aminobenzoyl-glutamate utilization protein A